MRKIFFRFLIIISILFLTSCVRVDNPNEIDKKTEDKKEEVKTETEKTEETEEKEETKVEEIKDTEEKVEDTEKSVATDDEIIKDAKIASDISDDEIIWIVDKVKLFSNEDFEGIKKVLGGSAKDFAESNDDLLDRGVSPIRISGKIKKILSIDKTLQKDNDGTNVYFYTVLCEGENDNIYINVGRNDEDKLAGFQLNIASVIDNQEALQTKYKALTERAFDIIKLIKDGKYEEFMNETTHIMAEKEEIKKVYDMALEGFNTSGKLLRDKYRISEENLSDVIETTKEGLAIQVYIRLVAENYSAIDFQLFFDEDDNLLAISYNRYK